MIALAQIPGVGTFKMVSGGLFLPWNGQASGLSPFAVKKLGAQDQIPVLNDLVGANSNLAGLDFQVYFGYFTGGDNTTPATLTIDAGTKVSALSD